MKGCDERHEVAAPMNFIEHERATNGPSSYTVNRLAFHNGDRKECRH